MIADRVDAHLQSPYRWRGIGGMSAAFYHHPYASDHPWFVKYEWSYEHQGDEKGTAHPNGQGHRAYAAILEKSLELVIR